MTSCLSSCYIPDDSHQTWMGRLSKAYAAVVEMKVHVVAIIVAMTMC